MLKRKDVFECVIDHVDYPNKGRFRTEEGQKLTVKNTLPGQRIKCRIFKKHQDRVEGRFFELVEKSPLETREKACDIFPLCGGCLTQTMPYDDQLALKSDMVKRLLAEVMDEDTIFDGIMRSPLEFEYRNKMEFSFGDEIQDGPLTLGLHRRNTTYTVLNADSCKLVHTDVRKVLSATLKYCREKNLPKYDKKNHTGFLRFLLVRRSQTTGELLVYLVTSSQMDHDFSDWAEALRNLDLEGAYAGIFHALDDSMGDALKIDKATALFGQDFFYEELLGLKFKVTAFSFFQTNTPGAEVLYDVVRKYVSGKAPILYDLYSGTGTIGQVLSLNGIENCEFIAGDVLEKLAEIPEKPDYIVLDPPREGINPKALTQIIEYGVGEMVYISCKASSFKRDMAVLREHGFRVKRWCLVDLFPQTMHVETVVLLSREKVDGHINIDLDVEKLESKSGTATYHEIKDYVEKKHGLNVSSLYIAQIKDKAGLEKQKNYNIGSGEGKVLTCPHEKEEAIMDAFRHFNLI